MAKGRPKGYSPYSDLTYEELGDWVGRKSLVKVSRAWLEALRDEPNPSTPIEQPSRDMGGMTLPIEKKDEPKIDYKLIDLNDE